MHLAQHATRRDGDRHADPPPPATEAQREVSLWLVTTLIVAVTLTVVTALVLGTLAYRAQQTISQNVAHVDRRATADATRQVSDIITKAFSFDYAKPYETEKFATERLRGQALDEYRRLLQPVKHQAATQKLVVTATVKSAGVITLGDRKARVLVLADQFAVRAGTNEYSGGPAQLEVTADRDGNRWNITRIHLL